MNQRELFLRHVAQTSDLPMMGVNINIATARGCKLKDASGKDYLDLISGISVSSVGHCHPRIVEAVKRQSEQYMHLMVYGEFAQQPQASYAEALSTQLNGLDSVFFTTGGSEAIEGALKLAKRATGRHEIVSFRKAYHGSTQGALSIMGDEFFKNSFRPLVPGGKIIPYNQVESLSEITTNTAAVVCEMVQAEAGVINPQPGFLKALRHRCDETGTLLIVDEIQTGFGRCGALFAYQKEQIRPDILVLAKAMGGGMPIGAFVASQPLMKEISYDPVLGHINTFGGNAVCVAAAQACLEILTEEKLWEKAKKIEAVFTSLSHPLIKEIRANGALIAIDFGEEALNMQVIKTCLEKGLITDWFLFCPTAMRIAPPLVINDEELQHALSVIRAAIMECSGQK